MFVTFYKGIMYCLPVTDISMGIL